MNKVVSLAAVSAVLGAVALAGSSFGNNGHEFKDSLVMSPGKGLSLDIGTKHAVSYFEGKTEGCQLTVVVAKNADGEVSEDSPGTRFTALVSPGASAIIDAADGKSAEFRCGPSAKNMSARVFDRPAWTGKSS
jgi:hypothetical protein